MGSTAGGEQSAIQPPVKLQLAKRPPSPAALIPPSEVVPDDMPEEELVMPEEEPDDAPDEEPNDAPEEEPDDPPSKEPNDEPEVDPLEALSLPLLPEFAPVPAQAPAANNAARRDPPPRDSRMRRNERPVRTAVIKVSAPRIVAATGIGPSDSRAAPMAAPFSGSCCAASLQAGSGQVQQARPCTWRCPYEGDG